MTTDSQKSTSISDKQIARVYKRVYYFLNVYKFLILLSMEVKGRDAVVLFQDEAEGIK
jgi:hypothetical protein